MEIKIRRILARNKETYVRYNNFRKQIFAELAHKESEVILYLLRWLLSINHPKCPGLVAQQKRLFKVFNVDKEQEIRRRERAFQRMFGIKTGGSLLKGYSNGCLIQGLYTIGSIGTVSQTPHSDCDIWICYDKRDFNQSLWTQFNKKTKLIKDWIDANLKMPVFFVI